jgi:hypothetical protein
MLIAILNQSTLVTDADARAMTRAVAKQVRMHAAPAWDQAPAAVVFFDDAAAVPPGAHGIAIVDTIKDQPEGVLGFHTEDQGGKLWGTVAAKPELDAKGKVLTGDWSVSSVLSHEVLEMYVDPNCNLWASDGAGKVYSFEVCDPVEAPTYVVDKVSVSNFVTPAWFDPLASKTATFDHLGKVKAPFGILPGGYVVYASSGNEHQKYGAKFPAWRKATKKGALARTRRRSAQASAFSTIRT